MKQIFTIFGACLLGLLMSACTGNNKNTQIVEEERIEQVKTRIVRFCEMSREIEVSTILQGYETQNIAPSLTGRIEKIYVEVGDHVHPNDKLVCMDQNQYNTTRLAFRNLKTEMDRMEKLKQSGSISQQSYDQMKLNYDQTIESLRFLEENTYVKAPFEGVISAKNYEDGELYNGQAILVLTQISTLKALVNIPESYFPMVKPGMKVNLKSSIYKDEIFPATIELVYPTIDANTHTFQVKLRIPNKDERLRPGMYVGSSIAFDSEKVFMVPYQAVLKLTGSNERYIFLNENGIAKRVKVQIGERFNEMIEISAPEVKEGAEIVVVGQSRLVDGVKLNVIK
nr:efflux RND transporter periplasmic adaptor subunit [Bacteroidales bacterium]